jgi:hypothetical protein
MFNIFNVGNSDRCSLPVDVILRELQEMCAWAWACTGLFSLRRFLLTYHWRIINMNLKGIKLTQEQVRCKNKIIDLAITYLVAKDKFKKGDDCGITAEELKQMETELQKLIADADKLYGKWFIDRCMEIARSLTGLNL